MQMFYCLLKRPTQRTAQLLRRGIHISQEPAEPSCPIKRPPTPLKLLDSALRALALGPSLLYSHLPSPGGSNRSGVQLAVSISRCQEFENDLAHQLVGTQQTRESLYHCLLGPCPQKKGQ